MKKSVILLIAIVYIASMCIVGFFGIKIRTYDPTIPVEEIVCEMEGVELTEGHKNETIAGWATEENPVKYYYSAQFQEGLSILLKFSVRPDNATNRVISYTMAENKNCTIVDNGDGTAVLSFSAGTTVTVLVTSNDGQNIQTRIRVRVIKPR